MIKRIRQLRISLAAKCQILFGAAVILIIGATLFVPWHRMDDLMNQLNDRAAFTLAEAAKMDHVASEYKRVQSEPVKQLPATAPAVMAVATTQPWNELLDYQ